MVIDKTSQCGAEYWAVTSLKTVQREGSKDANRVLHLEDSLIWCVLQHNGHQDIHKQMEMTFEGRKQSKDDKENNELGAKKMTGD